MKLRISKSYGDKRVFENFALDIVEGEVTCILGASGVGKTTLLRIIAGLTDYEGEAELPARVAYIFQEHRLLPWLSVAENLRYVGASEEAIDEILREVGLYERRDVCVVKLSGGEKQRVAIARAFLVNAPVLLMDEPFGALDTARKVRLIELFARLWRTRKATAVVVTHDIEDALMIGHRIVVIKQGGIALDLRSQRTAFPTPYGADCIERKRLISAVLEEE